MMVTYAHLAVVCAAAEQSCAGSLCPALETPGYRSGADASVIALPVRTSDLLCESMPGAVVNIYDAKNVRWYCCDSG